jgi:hypothetical protein
VIGRQASRLTGGGNRILITKNHSCGRAILIAEIAGAKKLMISTFNILIPSGHIFRTERRRSSTRFAHDAEVEDIIDFLEGNFKFVAFAINCMPVHGPEETNIAAKVDKQLCQKSVTSELESQIDLVCSSVICRRLAE